MKPFPIFICPNTQKKYILYSGTQKKLFLKLLYIFYMHLYDYFQLFSNPYNEEIYDVNHFAQRRQFILKEKTILMKIW